MDFWNEIKNKSSIKFSDIEKLEKLLGSVFQKMDELEKSRDKWHEKYNKLKEKKK
jgi:hypothetical protein